MPRNTNTNQKSAAPRYVPPPARRIYPPTTPVLPQAQAPVTVAPSFGQKIKDGFSYGIGSAFAHRLFGPSPTVTHQTVVVGGTPSAEFLQCMKEAKNDREACKHLEPSTAPDRKYQ